MPLYSVNGHPYPVKVSRWLSITDALIHQLSTSPVDKSIISRISKEQHSSLYYLEGAPTRSSLLLLRQLEAGNSTENRCIQQIKHLVRMPSSKFMASKSRGCSLDSKPLPCFCYIIMTSGKPVTSRSWSSNLSYRYSLLRHEDFE